MASVFTSEVEGRATPLRARAGGMVLGTLLLVMLALALVSARTIPFLLAVVAAGFLVRAAIAGWLKDLAGRPNQLHVALAVFLGWALVTVSWSLDPSHALLKLLVAVAVVLGCTAIVVLVRNEDRANQLHIGEGIWIGLMIGLVYYLVEIATDQSIKIWVYNILDLEPADLPQRQYFRWRNGDIISISPVDLTRNTSSITLVMWGAMLAALGTFPDRFGRVAAGALFLLALVVVALSAQETSKLAIVVGIIAFGAALVSTVWTRRLMMFAWVACCLAIVPLALGLYRLDLHNAAFLPSSGQHRIIIWNYTAEQVAHAPLIGIGAHSTHELGPSTAATVKNAPGEKHPRTLSRHAHNIYLQTWFELGAIGALLLALVGVVALGLTRRFPVSVQPFALATFASGAVVGAASYGMWQIWYMAMYGMAFVVLGIGAYIYSKSARNATEQGTAGSVW